MFRANLLLFWNACALASGEVLLPRNYAYSRQEACSCNFSEGLNFSKYKGQGRQLLQCKFVERKLLRLELIPAFLQFVFKVATPGLGFHLFTAQ